jgi:hypothetical protein
VANELRGVPLADFVGALRSELLAAQAEAAPGLPLEVGPVTVEFTVMTRTEGEGRAGVRFWVVDAGVGGGRATESTQKVTMQLTPLDPTGRRSARIRDVESAGHDKPLPPGARS